MPESFEPNEPDDLTDDERAELEQQGRIDRIFDSINPRDMADMTWEQIEFFREALHGLNEKGRLAFRQALPAVVLEQVGLEPLTQEEDYQAFKDWDSAFEKAMRLMNETEDE